MYINVRVPVYLTAGVFTFSPYTDNIIVRINYQRSTTIVRMGWYLITRKYMPFDGERMAAYTLPETVCYINRSNMSRDNLPMTPALNCLRPFCHPHNIHRPHLSSFLLSVLCRAVRRTFDDGRYQLTASVHINVSWFPLVAQGTDGRSLSPLRCHSLVWRVQHVQQL